ncbi:MAG: MFS transporter [Spirulinaceae cyanobacterium RM2_2_10]|nr:MFS transporter [Spirulinaceae cyanobacterium RM2_2_10]
MIVRFGSRWIGEMPLAIGGTIITIGGFVCLAFAEASGLFYTGLLLTGLGSMVHTTLSSVASRLAPPDQQGRALGYFRSMGSLGRTFGPFAGGLGYYLLGPKYAYLLAGALLLFPLSQLRRVHLPTAIPPEAPDLDLEV